MPTAADPAISVVVPTYGRAGRLPRLVEAVAAQSMDVPYEMVVVDDASPDGTWAELERLAAAAPFPLRPVRLDANAGPATARNAGWRAARAPLVAFTDDDCVPQPGWLAALLDAFEDADVVQGATFPDPTQHRHRNAFSYTLRVTTPSSWFETCNLAYRRELLDRLGGFDERYRFPAGEDTDLGWRARDEGARIAFAPRATVLHDVHPMGFARRLRDVRRWEGVVQSVSRHPGLREDLHRGWFWKASHPPALATAAGLAAAAALAGRGHGRAAAVAAVAAWAPYGRFRVLGNRLPGGVRSLPMIPAGLVVDLAEVAVMARASLRHGTLVL